MIVLISDKHIGTTMWQAAILREAGVATRIESLSGHTSYAGLKASRDPIIANLHRLGPRTVRSAAFLSGAVRGVTHALCSFPPCRFEDLEKLPENIRILVNVGHRIHIHVPPDRLHEFTSRFRSLAGQRRFILSTMSEYDYHYTRYYTGLSLRRLPVTSFHIPASIRTGPYRPENRTVLIGPSQNAQTIIGFDNDLDRLNSESRAYAKRIGAEPFAFNFIRKVYPGETATFENIRRHPALLLSPYSAFSISMVELHQMNIPLFVPADEMLVDRMNDVRLAPLYHSAASVAAFDQAATAFCREDYPFSPNDPSPEAQRHWLRYTFLNQAPHIQRFASPDDLFAKLYKADLAAIHDAMQRDNAPEFARQLAIWRELLRHDDEIGRP